jgi:hypothetical protein
MQKFGNSDIRLHSTYRSYYVKDLDFNPLFIIDEINIGFCLYPSE